MHRRRDPLPWPPLADLPAAPRPYLYSCGLCSYGRWLPLGNLSQPPWPFCRFGHAAEIAKDLPLIKKRPAARARRAEPAARARRAVVLVLEHSIVGRSQPERSIWFVSQPSKIECSRTTGTGRLTTPCAASSSSGRARFFFQYLGACRRRRPRTRADLNVPKDASDRELSDATSSSI